MALERPEETMARQVVSESLGVRVEPYDCNSRPRMVDAIFAYPDGRRAALEITSDEHEAARQQAERLADDNWTYSIAGLKQGWYVRVSLDSRINQLEKDLLGILG